MKRIREGDNILVSINLGNYPRHRKDGKPYFSESALGEILEYQVNTQFPHSREIIYQQRGQIGIITNEVLDQASKLPPEEQAFFLNEQLNKLKHAERIIIRVSAPSLIAGLN